jgi:sec-independent protein translocase protein TatA
MADLGWPELTIIAIAVVLLFGWKRMPDMARSLGRSARIFKSEVDQMRPSTEPSGTPSREGVPDAAPRAGFDEDRDAAHEAVARADDRVAEADAEVARLRAELVRRRNVSGS